MNLIQKKNWLTLSIFNLCLVAFLGVLMRYKIGFEFPFFDQKHIQHAHSHFAFAGWIAHTIFVLMLVFLQDNNSNMSLNKYNKLIYLNLLASYGMLISFFLNGYSSVSIFCSTASIFITYLFAFYYFLDLNKIAEHPSKNWFKASLIFYILSSIGTFVLAYMMISKNLHHHYYFASVYYYLHFQYNGFFFFACMGLLVSQWYKYFPEFNFSSLFWLFAIALIPTYFLSVLWLKLPFWLYVLVVIGSLLQTFGWVKLIQFFRLHIDLIKSKVDLIWQYLFILLAFSVSVKLLLQLGSTIPSVSKLAFGFRPIVIAYLHLVLLAIITLFLLVYMYSFNILEISKKGKSILLIFVFGVFLNEFILLIQGVGAFTYTVIPYANLLLLIAAIIMFVALFILWILQ